MVIFLLAPIYTQISRLEMKNIFADSWIVCESSCHVSLLYEKADGVLKEYGTRPVNFLTILNYFLTLQHIPVMLRNDELHGAAVAFGVTELRNAIMVCSRLQVVGARAETVSASSGKRSFGIRPIEELGYCHLYVG
jgi:hypothetical protein